MSHPTRVRGLKWWVLCKGRKCSVAPYTGAWIEIKLLTLMVRRSMSHPTRVRGLKSAFPVVTVRNNGRTLHGCVD